MKILFFCRQWGQENIPWNIFVQEVKDAGYDGVESSLPLDVRKKEDVTTELAKQEIWFIRQHWQTVTPDFDAHYKEFEMRLRSLATAKPLSINSRTGKDYYSFEQNRELIKLAKTVSTETGVAVVHETHRGKLSFAIY
jgi:hypothetical protein